MQQVWEIPGIKPAEKLVLIALADMAGEDGSCWPSMRLIADRCSMGERGVRGIVSRLREAGYIAIERSHGRSTNRYNVLPNPERHAGLTPANPERGAGLQPVNPEPHAGLSDLNPERHAGLEGINPERHDTNPERHDTQPGTAVPPNHKEPKKNHERKKAPSLSLQREPIEVLRDVLSEDDARDVVQHRKQKKAPLTERAAAEIVKELRKLRDAGMSPSDAVGVWLKRGWASIEAKWFLDDPQRNNGSHAAPEQRSIFQQVAEREARQGGGVS